jgi:uncharacterized membrane protein
MRFLKRNADAMPFLIPAFILFFDLFASVLLLRHEPGVTASDVAIYHLMLLPGSVFFSAGTAILLNIALGIPLGFLVKRLATGDPHAKRA